MSLQTNLYRITTTVFIYIFENQYLSYKNNYFVLDTYVRKDSFWIIDIICRGASEVNLRKIFMNVECNEFQNNNDKITEMVISPAHFDEMVKHSPLRVLKSYDLCKQVMCMRARCQERSFHLEDLIRGKWPPLLFLRHPVYTVNHIS